jgi:hypothetical protein
MPTRTTIEPVILTFAFNSQDRQRSEVHEAHKKEPIEPLQEEPNKQEVNAPKISFLYREVK